MKKEGSNKKKERIWRKKIMKKEGMNTKKEWIQRRKEYKERMEKYEE